MRRSGPCVGDGKMGRNDFVVEQTGTGLVPDQRQRLKTDNRWCPSFGIGDGLEDQHGTGFQVEAKWERGPVQLQELQM